MRPGKRVIESRLLLVALATGCGPAGRTDSVSDEGSTSSPGTTQSTGTETTVAPTTTGDTDPTSTDTGGSTDESTGSTSGDDTGPGIPSCGDEVLVDDVLDADDVYLAGTLSEGACYLDVLAHWNTPDDAVAGFDCYFDYREAVIRPTDGRLIYTNTFEGLLREFHCDVCPIEQGGDYPNTPLNNDVVLPTPACDPDNVPSMPFLVSPAGSYVYRCSTFETSWYDGDGNFVHDNVADALLHLGYGELALAETNVVDLQGGMSTPIQGLPLGDPVAIRADPEDGFLVVKPPEQPELWHVKANGEATSLGIYPAIPPDIIGTSQFALDGCRVLFQIARGPEVFQDIILRRALGGTTEVVYDESTDPLVKIHASDLITGP